MLRAMSQFKFFDFEAKVYTVAEINRYVRERLESDYRLGDLWVGGEVSNLSRPASGHMYFTLRGEEAALRCVMWRPDVAKLEVDIQDGDGVEVHGHISVYEAGGLYQLYADRIRPRGEGVLFQQFLRLKERLEAEGLFAPERKRALPAWPRRIGVVTSSTAAALRDVIHVLARRYPLVELVLSPAPVQGETAPAAIVQALEAVNAHTHPDLVLLVRGGGSMEDLWAFNDERVVRAIAHSQAPVVVGVGHETDLILADFAADVRAPTPTAAAEVAVPDRLEMGVDLAEQKARLVRTFADQIRALRRGLEMLTRALFAASPRAQLAQARQQVDELVARATRAVIHDLDLRRASVQGLRETLRVVGPESVLSRGYALVMRAEDQSLVRSVKQVRRGDGLRIRVRDGDFPARVEERS
jgi:exodeoxyribonuclease VII large subunit